MSGQRDAKVFVSCFFRDVTSRSAMFEVALLSANGRGRPGAVASTESVVKREMRCYRTGGVWWARG